MSDDAELLKDNIIYNLLIKNNLQDTYDWNEM
jgi:hypothetical protein